MSTLFVECFELCPCIHWQVVPKKIIGLKLLVISEKQKLFSAGILKGKKKSRGILELKSLLSFIP